MVYPSEFGVMPGNSGLVHRRRFSVSVKHWAVTLFLIPALMSIHWTAQGGPVSPEILVSRDLYLYVPQSDNRRLLLEPGSLLMEKFIPQREVFKKRIRVIS
ncbi:MAG: hypothetical protein GKR95_16275 [Gammaproteobacteria bacterium]|nr:hypothetical protein [Gammaproteobacteria bacterium]NKB63597.1 hypothetical protein [Gammaproteobacteria bacterium]